MIPLILIPVVWVIASIICYKAENWGDWDWCDLAFSIFMGFLVAIVFALLSLAVGACVKPSADFYSAQDTETYSIVATTDNFNVSGHTHYHSGYIDEKLQYTVMYKTDGGYTTMSFPAEDTIIITSDTEAPRVEKTEYECPDWYSVWFLPVHGMYTRYKLIVPSDVIPNDITIDLSGG